MSFGYQVLGFGGGASLILPPDYGNVETHFRFNSGITVVGAGVDTWVDEKNGSDLRQTTDTNRPSKESDGSILFDGVDNFLQTSTITLDQPETIYVLGLQDSWTSNDTIYDGDLNNTGRLYQTGSSPRVLGFAGDSGAVNDDWILDAYAVVTHVLDHDATSQIIVVNKGTESTDTSFGSAAMNGFHLGCNGNESNFSNIQIKEVILYSVAHDAATRTSVIDYLSDVGGLGL